MLDRAIRDIRLLWRAEAGLAAARLRGLGTSAGLVAAIAVLGLLALLMVNLAGFFLLDPWLGRAGAAGGVALADLLLALVLLLVLRRPGQELAMAQDMRALALGQIEADARALQAEIAALRGEITAIGQALRGVGSRPVDAALAGLAAPLAEMLVRALHRKAAEPDQG